VKETFVKELFKTELNNPVLIEGLPGLGLVGKIATRYLVTKREVLDFYVERFISGKTAKAAAT
jgi:proteasome assembly chaperone (PAC2) family protein